MQKLHIVSLVILTSICAVSQSLAQPEQQPNVLFVISDDQSWLHTSVSGDPIVSTPGFDRIAREGIRFTHSFAASPSCTASRSAVLTGQDVWRIKQAGVLFGAMPPEVPVLTHLLSDAGYHIGSTGKGWAPGKWDALGLSREPFDKIYDSRTHSVRAQGVDTRDYQSNFRDFLSDKEEGQPFFFWFGSTEPHRIYQPNVGETQAGYDVNAVSLPGFWPDVDEIRRDVLDYYYEIEWFDSHLQSMIRQLEEFGELDNTIIIVTSDNGMPFPRAKTTLYDWGTRVPLAIRWGNNLRDPGRVVSDFVKHIDFAPTILAAAGLEVPQQMNGQSLLPIIKSQGSSQENPGRHSVVTGIERHTWTRPEGLGYPSRAIRTYKYLYIRNYFPDRWPSGGPEFVSSNKTRYGDTDASPTKEFLTTHKDKYEQYFQLNFGKRPSQELYSLENDPDQVVNLADDPRHAQVKSRLSSELERILSSTGDPRAHGVDPWRDYTYYQEAGFGASFNSALPDDVRRRARLSPGNAKPVIPDELYH